MRIFQAGWTSPETRELVVWVVVVLVLWFVNMAVTGMVARRQGRDDGLWALIGFLVGPVALVVLLLTPRSFLRRSVSDPEIATPASAPEWQPHAEGWVQLTYPPAPITINQRLLGAAFGAALAAAGAALLLAVAGQPIVFIQVVVWSMAGAVAGYVLSAELIGAEGRRLVWVGLLAGALAIILAELLVGVIVELDRTSIGALRIFSIMIAVGTALVYPVVYALFAQGLLAAALAGGMIWAALTNLLLRRGSGQAEGSLAAR